MSVSRRNAAVPAAFLDQQREVPEVAFGIADELAESRRGVDLQRNARREDLRLHAALCKRRPRVASAKHFVVDGTGRPHAYAPQRPHPVETQHFQKDEIACAQQPGGGGRHADLGQRVKCQMLQRKQGRHAATAPGELHDHVAAILDQAQELGLFASCTGPSGLRESAGRVQPPVRPAAPGSPRGRQTPCTAASRRTAWCAHQRAPG